MHTTITTTTPATIPPALELSLFDVSPDDGIAVGVVDDITVVPRDDITVAVVNIVPVVASCSRKYKQRHSYIVTITVYIATNHSVIAIGNYN